MAHRLINRPNGSAPSGEARDTRQQMKRKEMPARPQERDTPKETPETPTDEPKPAPVQEPPPEPDPAPYVVRGRKTGPRDESRIMNEAAKATGERKERRGFASMSPEKQREIASKGGRAAHQKGTAHEWTSEEARSAGRKGGQISRGGRGRLIEPVSPAPQPAPGSESPGALGGE